MVFNSLSFLLVFLPVSFAVHATVDRFRPGWRPALLVFLSFVFYGWWDPRFVPLLGVSILVNWLFAAAYLRTRRSALIALAIAFDLFALALLKYLGFLANLALSLGGFEVAAASLFEFALPVRISFFTLGCLT